MKILSNTKFNLFDFDSIIINGFRKPLERKDLWLLREEETTHYSTKVFTHRWEEAYKQWRETMKNIQKTNKTQAFENKVESEQNNTQTPEAKYTNNDKNATSNPRMEEVNGKNASNGTAKNEKNMKKIEELMKGPLPPFVPMLIKVYGPKLFWAHSLLAIYTVITYVNPLIMW